VVVPAYRCADQLRASLPALRANDWPPGDWELIVVDDGSTDETTAVATALADRVVRVPDGPGGPGLARNLGANEARGDILLFVDADVVVHKQVLARVAAHFQRDAALVAVFGSYDDRPAAPGVISQYRNLLHRYVHLESAGAVTTFWAGCGAVRRDAFLAVGGFDGVRFPRPQIEDIDLGYRLHDRGGIILLDPAIGGTHLKRWTLAAMLRTDLRDRAIPWMRLLLDRRTVLASGPLNTARREQLFAVCTGLAVLAALVAVITGGTVALVVAIAALAVVVAGNLPLFTWFARARGIGFACAVVPLRLLFYVVSVAGAAWAIGTNPFRAAPPARDVVPPSGDVASAPSA
jgi:hypothetical protein